MSVFDEMLGNYPHRRHFLQTINLPTQTPSGGDFLYMKNHKAACTTILATLMRNLEKAQGGNETLSMDTVHSPTKSLLLTGPRGLSDERVTQAVNDPKVFKFTIVRDPVSRTVSAYADKVLGGQKQKARLMAYLGRPHDSKITLKQFIALLAKDEGARDLDRHWRSQRKEISYDQIDFDYIGTVATIKPSMDHIMKRIFGTEALGEIVDTRGDFGHKTSSRDMIETLSSRDMKNLEKAFGPDFEMYETVQQTFAKALM